MDFRESITRISSEKKRGCPRFSHNSLWISIIIPRKHIPYMVNPVMYIGMICGSIVKDFSDAFFLKSF